MTTCVFDEPCLDTAGPDAPLVDAEPLVVIDAPPPDAPPAGVAHLDPADAVVGAADLRVMTGTVTIDTSALTISGISGSGVTVVAAAQVPAGPELAVLRLDALGVASGATLKAIGTRPLVIVARNASIDGTLTASAVGSVPGAGGAAAAMGPGRGLSGATASDNDGGGGGAGQKQKINKKPCKEKIYETHILDDAARDISQVALAKSEKEKVELPFLEEIKNRITRYESF